MKVLTSRVRLVRRLVKAVLRRLRIVGFDNAAHVLRIRLAAAVARLDRLVAGHPGNDVVLEAVMRVRIGILGVNDQIDAMAAACKEPRPVYKPEN